MPGPPPNGASSTLRCTSCAQARRSWTASSMMPRSAAFPSRETRRGAKYSGKIVMTSIFTVPARVGTGITGIAARATRREVEQARGRVDDQLPGGEVNVDGDRGDERDEYLRPPPCAGRG